MKNFLRKIVSFITLLFALSVISHYVTPNNKYWGNYEYASKLRSLTGRQFNTYFFGSSRILSGINPVIFDSLLTRSNNEKIKSFNLATAGTWANENFYLYNQFLFDTAVSSHTNLVFMEFQNIMAIRPDKLTSDKSIYYQSFDNLSFSTRYSLNEIAINIKNIPSSAYITGSCMLAGLQKVLNFNQLNLKEPLFDSLAYFGTNARGYLQLEKRKTSRTKTSTKDLEAYKQNIKTYLYKPTKNYNHVFYQKCMDVIHQSNERGIKLVFVLPPVKLTSGMIAVYNALPKENKIELCDPSRFPELYVEENWIDETHLSKNGSYFLNRYLADGYSKLTQRNATN